MSSMKNAAEYFIYLFNNSSIARWRSSVNATAINQVTAILSFADHKGNMRQFKMGNEKKPDTVSGAESGVP